MLGHPRLARLALGVVVVTSLLLAPTGVSAAPKSSSSLSTGAPLDEYFGHLQMSVLGIRNELRTISQRVTGDPKHAGNAVPMLTLVEDSVHDWENKYPHDSWIPMDLARLERDYLMIPTLGARIHAMHVIKWMQDKYSSSPAFQGVRASADRALGIHIR